MKEQLAEESSKQLIEVLRDPLLQRGNDGRQIGFIAPDIFAPDEPGGS